MPHLKTDKKPDVFVFGLGDIGYSTISAIAASARVRGFDINPTKRARARNAFGLSGVEIVEQESSSMVRAKDIVIDCTRYAELGAVQTRVIGRGACAYIHLSSFAVYRSRQDTITEDSACNPATNYGVAKLLEEKATQSIGSETERGSISLRLSGFVGSYCREGSSKSTRYVHSAVVEMARADRPTAPTNLSEYIDEDRYSALIAALVTSIQNMRENQRLPQVLNVGGGYMLTHAHAWEMFNEGVSRPMRAIEALAPEPQFPLMSQKALAKFLGAETYSAAIARSPLKRFWSKLVPAVLSDLEHA